MEEIKNKIKALTTEQAVLVYGVFAAVLLLFYLVIPQYCVRISMFGQSASETFGFFKIGDIFSANAFMGILMIINVLALAYALFIGFVKKAICEKVALFVVVIGLLTGIISFLLKPSAMGMSFGNFGIAFGWILNLLIGAAWVAYAKLRNA